MSAHVCPGCGDALGEYPVLGSHGCVPALRLDLDRVTRERDALEDAYENCRRERDQLSEANDERTEHHYRRLQAEAKLESAQAALVRAREDINWMLNERKFLNPEVFDYLDTAIASLGDGL